MILLDILSICNWPILFGTWLLSFLLGFLAAWSFLSKYKKHIKHLEKENTSFSSTINSLRADVESCQKARNNAKSEIELLRGQLLDKDNRIKKTQQAHAEMSDLFEEQKEKNDKALLQLKYTEEKLQDAQKNLNAYQDNEVNRDKNQDKKSKPAVSKKKNQNDSSDQASEEKEPIRPILNKTDNKDTANIDSANEDDDNIVEIERVKSALTEASIGKVDEIIEKIERKKKKKEKKKLKNKKNQDSHSKNRKENVDSPDFANKSDDVAQSDQYPSKDENKLNLNSPETEMDDHPSSSE